MSEPKLIPFLSAAEIAATNQKLATQITKDYEPIVSQGGELVLVVTLKGALLFAADLVRHLDLPLKLDFVRVASYGSGTQSSGTVMMTKDIETAPPGKHLLILDEIIDSGHTIKFLMDKFKPMQPASLKVCTLLNKPSRREAEVAIDYVGIDVEDKFLVGYGLDFDEKYRNLKEIYVLEP